MGKQTWTITATPRERAQLALVLLTKDLCFETREENRKLHRARRALGLLGVSEEMLASGYKISKYQRNTTERHRFSITVENAEFLLDAYARSAKLKAINTAGAMWLEPLLEQLEAKEDAADAETAAPFDDAVDAPKWKYRATDPPDEDETGDEPDVPPPDPAPPADPPPPPPAQA